MPHNALPSFAHRLASIGARIRCTMARSSVNRNGFARKLHPSACNRIFCASSTMPPEIINTGNSLRNAFSSTPSSRPDRCGIYKSVTRRSICGTRRKICDARSASPELYTAYPSCSKNVRVSERISGSSSTTRIVPGASGMELSLPKESPFKDLEESWKLICESSCVSPGIMFIVSQTLCAHPQPFPQPFSDMRPLKMLFVVIPEGNLRLSFLDTCMENALARNQYRYTHLKAGTSFQPSRSQPAVSREGRNPLFYQTASQPMHLSLLLVVLLCFHFMGHLRCFCFLSHRFTDGLSHLSGSCLEEIPPPIQTAEKSVSSATRYT